MSYTLSTLDGKVYPMTDNDAKDLIVTWTSSDKAFPVEMTNGDVINSFSIKAITRNQRTEADMVDTGNYKQIRSDNRSEEEIYQAARKKAESIRDIIKRNGVKGLKK